MIDIPPALNEPAVIERVYPDLYHRIVPPPRVVKIEQPAPLQILFGSTADVKAKVKQPMAGSWETLRRMARTRYIRQHPDPAEQFVSLMRKQVGTPYVWGGSSPSGFDCSGLIYWAANEIGVNVPRTTYGLIDAGTPVSTADRSEWETGDLVFPHSGHVSIYVGAGKVVESPRSGLTVRVTEARPAIAVRRVV
jgi:cell wall-associated NlpC family hydrolase